VIRAFLRKNRRLRLERLPAYAPDLNPVEAVWSWLKWGRLSNFVPDDLNDLDGWVIDFLVELKHDPRLLRALWERSDLPFPQHPKRE
jgi:putative transposase